MKLLFFFFFKCFHFAPNDKIEKMSTKSFHFQFEKTKLLAYIDVPCYTCNVKKYKLF